VPKVSLRSAAVVVFVMLVLVPTRAEAAIESVTVKATRDYANAAGYTYAEITIHGSGYVARVKRAADNLAATGYITNGDRSALIADAHLFLERFR
jgi:hypothetical protein